LEELSSREAAHGFGNALMTAIAPLGSLIRKAAVPSARLERRAECAERCRFPASSFVVPMRRQKGPAQTRRHTMRVMVFAKATEGSEAGRAPTPGAIEAFKAMDQFTEELVKAGVFVAAAGLKNSVQAKRIVFDGPRRTVIDGPFAETRELVAGFSI